MAISIRTGANGSYKTAYVVWFVILPALRAGRVVVTNIEGMEPLPEIESRLGEKFPSTTRLIRIFSRDVDGIDLWQHFFCWCPLGALIVVDECQDIMSKNIGFDLRKIKSRPFSEFVDNLPPDFSELFYSRHIPVNMDSLRSCEVDDRGRAEYDSDGKIIYPLSFNEGFMRHRKYNWDIELLSPDWKQIDSGIKACAEQAFFHKNNDGIFWSKRRPYIYKHKLSATSIELPKKNDVNLTKEKIPVDAHLLYKSTGTGKVTKSGGINLIFKNPKLIIVMLIGLFCLGVLINGLSNLVFGESQEVEKVEEVKKGEQTDKNNQNNTALASQGNENGSVVHSGGNTDSVYIDGDNFLHLLNSPIPELQINGLKNVYLTSYTYIFLTEKRPYDVKLRLSLKVETDSGSYHISESYLRRKKIGFNVLDECLLELVKDERSYLVGCAPLDEPTETQYASNGAKPISFSKDILKLNN